MTATAGTRAADLIIERLEASGLGAGTKAIVAVLLAQASLEVLPAWHVLLGEAPEGERAAGARLLGETVGEALALAVESGWRFDAEATK